MEKGIKKRIALAALFTIAFFLVAGIMEIVEARSRGGGRSFGRSSSFSRSTSQTAPRQNQNMMNPSSRPTNSPLGGSFTRGLAGGLVGGALGSMLFGGVAHGMGGMGGLGGSGIGLFEILLLGGIGFFLYRWFQAKKQLSPNSGAGFRDDGNASARLFSGASRESLPKPDPDEDPLVAGVKEIWTIDPDFDPDGFKETAQDLFFKIQAGWTRRDTQVLKPFVGDQLLKEYGEHFQEMKQKGELNRLENIAVRRIDLLQAGVDQGEIFVTVRFTANLLDYTVDEKSNQVTKGDPENPVKFEEDWTFATPVGSKNWKLEGIENL